MTQKEVLEKTRQFVAEKFAADATGHDYWHMLRVWKLAEHIASQEKDVDMFTLELAAWLHDAADYKLHDGDEETQIQAIGRWLKQQGVDDDTIGHVQDIIRNIGFKGGLSAPALHTIEGQIVHDADKLDAMGAIGIARAFIYQGATGRSMHDPSRKIEQYESVDAYKHNDNTTINHFYEKLLRLKGRMLTKTGKAIAQHRHKVMENYLEEFYGEWDGRV